MTYRSLACGRLELIGAQVAQGRVSASGVVVSGVVRGFLAGDLAAPVRFHFQLRFERAKTGLHEGVVVAVVGATHALQHAGTGQQAAVLRARVLTSPIAVVNEARRRLA